MQARLQSFLLVNPVPGLLLCKPTDRELMRLAKQVNHVLCYEHCERFEGLTRYFSPYRVSLLHLLSLLVLYCNF